MVPKPTTTTATTAAGTSSLKSRLIIDSDDDDQPIIRKPQQPQQLPPHQQQLQQARPTMVKSKPITTQINESNHMTAMRAYIQQSKPKHYGRVLPPPSWQKRPLEMIPLNELTFFDLFPPTDQYEDDSLTPPPSP